MGGACRGLMGQAEFTARLRAFAKGSWLPPADADGKPILRFRPGGSDFRAGGMHRCASFWSEAVKAASCTPLEASILMGVVVGGLDLMVFFEEPVEPFQGGVGALPFPKNHLRSHRKHERLIPPMRFKNRPLDPLPPHLGVAEQVLHEKVMELVTMGAARECRPGEVPWCVSPISLVVNGSGTKCRLIHDLRAVNHWLQAHKFVFPTLREWVKGVGPDHLLVSVDWQAAYHAILLTPDSQLLCGFEHRGRLYLMVAMPFGLCIAPWLFQLSAEVFHAMLRRHGGLKSMGFIDDSAANEGPKHGQSALQRGRGAAWALCEGSFLGGHTVSVAKSQLEPQPDLLHLGLWVHAARQAFTVPAAKLAKFKALLERLRVDRTAHVVDLQRIAGWLVAMTAAIPCALVMLRELFSVVAGALKRGDRVVAVDTQVARDALAALEDVELWSEAFAWPSDSHLHMRVLATDASCTGVAGVLCDAVEDPLAPLLYTYRRGLTMKEGDLHIMINEGQAVLEALVEFQDRIKGAHLRILVDNTATQLALAGVGSKNLELNAVVKQVWRLLIRLAVTPVFDRVSTEDNCLADAGSREDLEPLEVRRDRGLAPAAHVLLSLKYPRFVPVWERPRSEMCLHERLVLKALAFAGGSINLDLFASAASAVVPRFVGLLREDAPGQQGVDAFSFVPSPSDVVFVNAPWHLLAAVHNHLRTVKASGVWDFPDDARALWFPTVRAAVSEPVLLARAGEKKVFVSGGRVLPAGRCDLVMAKFAFS